MWNSDPMDQAPGSTNLNSSVGSDPKQVLQKGRELVEALEQGISKLHIRNPTRIEVWEEELKTYVHDTVTCITLFHHSSLSYVALDSKQKIFRQRLLPFVEVRPQTYLNCWITDQKIFIEGTGAGKSSIINAILDSMYLGPAFKIHNQMKLFYLDEIVPTSGMAGMSHFFFPQSATLHVIQLVPQS